VLGNNGRKVVIFVVVGIRVVVNGPRVVDGVTNGVLLVVEAMVVVVDVVVVVVVVLGGLVGNGTIGISWPQTHHTQVINKNILNILFD